MSKLILLGTTLGNLEDVSLRGLKAVFESPIVFAEDTRVFAKYKGLLKQRYLETIESLEIKTETDQVISSYREQNHNRSIAHILELLKNNNDIVLTTDAGMPAISDPGWKLIRDVIAAGFEIDVIPGPTAVETALVLSGLPTDKFSFLGFLPRTEGKFIKEIEKQPEGYTIIFYESPYRVVKILSWIQKAFGDNFQVAAVNDITKKFQKVVRGNASEVIKQLEQSKVQGEWVICLRAIKQGE